MPAAKNNPSSTNTTFSARSRHMVTSFLNETEGNLRMQSEGRSIRRLALKKTSTQVVKCVRKGITPMASAKSDVATIEGKPQAITIEIPKTAVIVVDMQNDFGSKGGMFDRAGLDISMIRSAVPHTSRVLASARQCGIAIIYLKMGFRPDLSDLGDLGSPNRTRHLHFG